MRAVLFLDRRNAARSILAEGLLAHAGRGRFHALSAGFAPAAEPHPFALDELSAYCFTVDGLRSKHWREFAAPDTPPLDFVISLCEKAPAAFSADWPGKPQLAHWPIRDPLENASGADEGDLRRAFARTFSELGRRIYIFANLPFDTLDASRLERELAALGDLSEIGK